VTAWTTHELDLHVTLSWDLALVCSSAAVFMYITSNMERFKFYMGQLPLLYSLIAPSFKPDEAHGK